MMKELQIPIKKRSKEEQREYWNNWYKNSPEQHKKAYEKNKISRMKRAAWMVEYKSHCNCLLCNENHISTLEFHHLNPKEKDIDISNTVRCYYSYKNIIKELEKCVCLCANCHRKIHYNNEEFL